MPDNRLKSARVLAISVQAWTGITTVAALFCGIRRNLSFLYFAGSTEVRPNIAFVPDGRSPKICIRCLACDRGVLGQRQENSWAICALAISTLNFALGC